MRLGRKPKERDADQQQRQQQRPGERAAGRQQRARATAAGKLGVVFSDETIRGLLLTAGRGSLGHRRILLRAHTPRYGSGDRDDGRGEDPGGAGRIAPGRGEVAGFRRKMTSKLAYCDVKSPHGSQRAPSLRTWPRRAPVAPAPWRTVVVRPGGGAAAGGRLLRGRARPASGGRVHGLADRALRRPAAVPGARNTGLESYVRPRTRSQWPVRRLPVPDGALVRAG